MNWMQVEEYLQHDDRAVLPLGSTEQHSYLRLTVDCILPERVAVEAAEPLGVPVFPVVAYGVTPYFREFPGSISLARRHASRRRSRHPRQHGAQRLSPDSHRQRPRRQCARCSNWRRNGPRTTPTCRVIFHNWWNAPATWAKVQAIDPVASHGSWMENFPWTRLPNVAVPAEQRPMVDLAKVRMLDPVSLRRYLGDGNYGGLYQRPDDDMTALWKVAVEETRALLGGSWGE